MTSLFFANPALGCPGRRIGIMVASILARIVRTVAPNGLFCFRCRMAVPGRRLWY
ncbi:MAG: hypothetical protein V6Z86_08565 [Hyphomicrobiales bacterium]